MSEAVKQPRFRIVLHPWFTHTAYQVEQWHSPRSSLDEGYWINLDGFKTQAEAEAYVAMRLDGPRVLKEYA